MRILIATRHRGIVGGVETYLQSLIPALLEREHCVALLCEHGLAQPGNPSVDPVEANLPVWYCQSLSRQPDLWRELRDWKPDVVYSNGLDSFDIEEFLQEQYQTVAYQHGYQGTCTTGRKCHALPRLQPCAREFGPMCLLLHYPRRCGGLDPWVTLKLFRSEMLRKSRLTRNRAVLVASSHMYSELRKHGLDPTRLHLVRLPLTKCGSSLPPAPRSPQGRLLFVGRLTDVKGASFLIRAMPEVQRKLGRSLTLMVAGDGAEFQPLQHLARTTGIVVNFAGWVDGPRKMELMRGADLLVVPSLWPEPFGMVGIEAAGLGLPSAGFAVGGIPDWLIPGQTGELASGSPPTVAGLAAAIVKALGDQEHYHRLCRGAWEFSRQFSLEQHVAQLETVLEAYVTGASEQLADVF